MSTQSRSVGIGVGTGLGIGFLGQESLPFRAGSMSTPQGHHNQNGDPGDPGDPPLDRVTGQGHHSRTPMNTTSGAKNAVHGDPGDPIFAVGEKIFYPCRLC